MLNIGIQFFGGRGSGGGARAGGGGMTADQQVVNSMLSSANILKNVSINGELTWKRVLDPSYSGPIRLAELLGSRSFKDFESNTGLSKNELVSAVKKIHPDKNVSLVKDVRKRDRYARGGGSPAKTIFKLEIN